MSGEPVLGRIYVCRVHESAGWQGERVVVCGVSREQQTARVRDIPKPGLGPAYETVVSWSDLDEEAP